MPCRPTPLPGLQGGPLGCSPGLACSPVHRPRCCPVPPSCLPAPAPGRGRRPWVRSPKPQVRVLTQRELNKQHLRAFALSSSQQGCHPHRAKDQIRQHVANASETVRCRMLVKRVPIASPLHRLPADAGSLLSSRPTLLEMAPFLIRSILTTLAMDATFFQMTTENCPFSQGPGAWATGGLGTPTAPALFCPHVVTWPRPSCEVHGPHPGIPGTQHLSQFPQLPQHLAERFHLQTVWAITLGLALTWGELPQSLLLRPTCGGGVQHPCQG